MRQSIGVLATRHIWVGRVENDRLAAPVRIFPEPGNGGDNLRSIPAEQLAQSLSEQIVLAAGGFEIAAVGVGFPGIIVGGTIEECPNLQQFKGFHLQTALSAALARQGLTFPVSVLNDADAIAAGIAATRGQLERLVRVWHLGDGVGFGRYPRSDQPGEGGHLVVTLDPRERFCGCGGLGHLEGILGQRAMRLRFLDLEPEEVFAAARAGDSRCVEFLHLWHRALAAASATCIHLEGAGKFFLTGPNAEFVDLTLLGRYLHEMVTMSPLQGSFFEIAPAAHQELAIIGAAAAALA
ncbi:MAG TPA: ROK family protein [Bryobacteraceae bacterium]|nr:ROK family protein [Bryobacteraceae bacterium]